MNSEQLRVVTIIYDFIKKELSGWNLFEVAGLMTVLFVIMYNALIIHDSIISVISAICGILYTLIAGKGKISCYVFGLAGSSFYAYLAFSNALWGNLLLYAGYYIPMQIIGVFQWKKNLKKSTQEIYKTALNTKERFIVSIVTFILWVVCCFILSAINDSHPVTDSLTTILSIAGMYMTVRRCIEQWVVWTIVNSVSILMWFSVVQSGQKTYSTLVMWSVYLVLGIYFYIQWRNELKS